MQKICSMSLHPPLFVAYTFPEQRDFRWSQVREQNAEPLSPLYQEGMSRRDRGVFIADTECGMQSAEETTNHTNKAKGGTRNAFVNSFTHPLIHSFTHSRRH